jgi:hypothetical protein
MQLEPQVFYDLTFEEFNLKLEGMRQMENLRSREAWERTRELAFTMAQFSGNLKKGSTKYHLMRFPWDEKGNTSHIANLTGEERREAAKALIEERQRHLNEFLNKRKN